MILVAEAVLTGLLGLWMVSGAYDNWRHPDLNRSVVAEVFRLTRIARDYPEEFVRVQHRRIDDPRLVGLAFRLIVLWETLASVLLILGAVLLGLAAVTGAGAVPAAQGIAIAGALAFTVTWASFLIGGNYFLYYYCHFEGQVTHFLLAIWGTIVVAILV